MDKNQIFNNTIFINTKELDEKPGPFCMSYSFNIKTLMSSIEKIGLINKPHVRRNKAGFIDIITGYRRIMALKALNWDRVPCIELTDSGISDNDLLILNLYDNICTRRFNYVEKGMILNRLLMFFTKGEIYQTYMNILGISNRREADLLSQIQDLDDDVKNIIASDSLSIKTIESLFELGYPARNKILAWITNLKLNFNQQALFIEYIIDISIREETSIQELLDEEIFVSLMAKEEQNTPQKAKRVIDLLRARRMPVLTKNEKTFTRQVSNLNLPKNVRIKHTPFFEGADYLLEISFKDGGRLKDTIEALARIKELSNIKDPWKE